jgi:hypothetical protein
MEGFEAWWHWTGSGIAPAKGHDHEEHAERISCIAWDAALASVGLRHCESCDEMLHEDDMTAADSPHGPIWRCMPCAEKAWDRQQESN